ncbi:MAG TPA: glucose 1-dehydrogenase [Candidatus Binatia bacterium]|nr:glucose 1-dehydrogenase [Candidatus Binatia bacterium]
MASGRLEGRAILITGGASGIGAACARRLHAEGARVLIADLDGPAAEKLAAELGQHAVRADVTRAADIEAMLDTAWRLWGRLDVLFNNAGIIQGKRLFDVTREDWDRVMDVNLKAVFFVMQAAARRMVSQPPIAGSELRGKLIHTASIAAYRGGLPLTAVYAASKAGVVSLARTAAQALAPHRITSNAICPGVVDTPLWHRLDAEWSALEGWPPGEAWKRRIAGIPLGRPERPEDVAGLVAFLASADSDYMTGQALNIDGGLVMGN